jgi:pimeloyl-ACP methyl ester carboxylesterase
MSATLPMGQDEWISSRGLSLHVRHWKGDGACFVLLHGLASNCLTWEAVARCLSSAGHEVVTVDQRGHGRSDKPACGYGFDEITSDLQGLIERMNRPERPIIAGQSWGGNVVLEFAARNPGIARGLVLVDGGYLELSTRPGATWERTAVELRPPSLAGRRRDDIAARLRQAHPDWTDEGIEATLGNFETLPDGTVRPWLSLDRHMAILLAMWDQHPTQLYGRVAEPVLIAAAAGPGERARLHMKQAQVEKAASSLARSRVHWFESTDHDIHVHRPQELAALILEAVDDGFFG